MSNLPSLSENPNISNKQPIDWQRVLEVIERVMPFIFSILKVFLGSKAKMKAKFESAEIDFNANNPKN